MIFEWDTQKEATNFKKHGVDFTTAQAVFFDKNRIIAHDEKHSADEDRWFCIGKVKGGILTVRFTYRNEIIRIIGAGEWRKGKKFYEETHTNR